MLEGWGRFVHRHRRVVLAVGVLSLLVSIGALTRGLRPPEEGATEGEARRVNRLIQQEIPRPTPAPGASFGSSFVAVFTSRELKATDPRFRDAALAALQPLRSDTRVVSIVTPYDAPAQQAAAMISRGGDRAIAFIQIKDSVGVAQKYYDEIRALMRSDTLEILGTGSLAIENAFDSTLEADLQRAEYIAIPLALLLLLLVFGTVVAALLPVAVGVLAMLGGLAAVVGLSRVMDVSSYANNIVTLIGLGVAIDYSLFIVQRFRDELAAGRSVEDAIARSMRTAGRAITFSGITVAIGLSAMLFYGKVFSSVGIAGALVVVFAVVYALTVLPALLGILGPRVNGWRLPLPQSNGRGLWHSIAHAVMARPILVLVPTVALVLAAGLPFLHIRLATADITALPPHDESRRGYDIFVSEFPGQDQSRIQIVVYFPGGKPLERRAELQDVATRIGAIPDVLRVESTFDERSVGEHIVTMSAFTNRAFTSDAARDVVRSIRSLTPPSGGEILVGGGTARDMDNVTFVAAQTPAAVTYVTLTTLVVLFLLLGSVLLPFKAVLMNMFSIAASFGALVWVFQDGNLATTLNFTPQSLDPILPVILFSIVFGLSMDYEVLLLSRMQEEYERGRDNRSAVAQGLEKSGRLITGAAAIMVGVFTAFALADVVIVKSIGLGLAIAVALDATVVRALIVPATMRLLGDLNWWAPRRLARLRGRFAASET
ncbi:MAG TPA: MMPL family transporter [Candidatus Limnocylindria bacterium]